MSNVYWRIFVLFIEEEIYWVKEDDYIDRVTRVRDLLWKKRRRKQPKALHQERTTQTSTKQKASSSLNITMWNPLKMPSGLHYRTNA